MPHCVLGGIGNAHSHPDGLYNIKNIGTSLYIDINPDRDTVVGYTLNIHPHGKLHQQVSFSNAHRMLWAISVLL
jgi:hypothetical protein